MSGWAGLAMLGSQLIQNRHSSMLAEEREEDARYWQEQMAKTQYQRTVADMRAAGLNPILAASKGFGPSQVPSATTVSVGSAPGVDFAGASAKEAQAELTKTQDLKARGEIELVGEQTTAARYDGLLKQAMAAREYASIPNIDADTALKLAQVPKTVAETKASEASAGQFHAQMQKLETERDLLVEDLKKQRNMGKISESEFGQKMNMLEYIFRAIGLNAGRIR